MDSVSSPSPPLSSSAPDGGAPARPYAFKPQGARGRRITVLSIDGGGVRGVIPAKILEYLEAALQSLDGPEVRIADYFDIIAGTSTGDLIAGLLNVVDPATKRPRHSAADVTSFYLDEAKVIFPPGKFSGWLGRVWSNISLLFGPRYSAKAIEQVLTEHFGDIRLHETFTDVLLPVFDVKMERPRFLSKLEAGRNALLDPLLRQACRATSAAPTYFPAAFFKTSDPSGREEEFNCVDGAIANGNPTFAAILHAVQEMQRARGDQFNEVRMFQGYSDFLVLSLGTGDQISSYQAKDVAEWGLLSWVYNQGKVPILNMVLGGSASNVDYSVSSFFEAQRCIDNYLRIQAYSMPGDTLSLDDSSAENLAQLQRIGTELLTEQVVQWDICEGQLVMRPEQGTNAEALTRFAGALSDERKARALHANTTGTQ